MPRDGASAGFDGPAKGCCHRPVLTADDLLAGPRGRGLCMAVAHRLSEDVWPAWLQTSQEPSSGNRRILLGAIAAADPTPVRSWTSPPTFLEPMRETVDNAMYWQPPHAQDLVLTDPEVIAALHPVADTIASAPATAWWTTPIELSQLRYTSRFGTQHPAVPPTITGAAERLSDWHARTLADDRDAAASRPADPAAPDRKSVV